MREVATTPLPDRAAIRDELAETRDRFRALLNSLSAADWKVKSANPAWTVGQLMYHMAWATGFMVSELNSAKRGRGFNPPRFVVDSVNVMITRIGAMRANRASIARKYDAGTDALIKALDGVRDEEWASSSTNFGVTNTVEHVFHIPAEHFSEHAPEILKALGRG